MIFTVLLILFLIICIIIIAVSTSGINHTIKSMSIIQEQQGELIIQQNGEIIEKLHEISEQNNQNKKE